MISPKTSKKKQVIEFLFNDCFSNGNMMFGNELVKEASGKFRFRNHFDVTKIDNSQLLPDLVSNKDYFIAHLGQGKHVFIKGINNWFHEFEQIPAKSCINWGYKKSILNELDSSESNLLSLGYNQRIIHDFLYDDNEVNPNIYNARRTNGSFDYKVGTTLVQTDKLQLEIDMTMELDGKVTIFECKNNFPIDFATYQIFHPFLYYHLMKKTHKLKIKEINCCYILKKRFDHYTKIRMYLYTFSDKKLLSSIKLIKCKEYNLTQK